MSLPIFQFLIFRWFYRIFHRRWIVRSGAAEEPLLGTADIQSLADLGNSFEMIRKMRVLPVAPADFIAMVLPGLIPALPLAATVLPVGEILKDLLTGGLTVAAVGAA